MTVKSILTRNNSLTLKPQKWVLSDQQEAGQILERHSESSFSNPTNVKEIEEGIRLWVAYLQKIR